MAFLNDSSFNEVSVGGTGSESNWGSSSSGSCQSCDAEEGSNDDNFFAFY